ncbi:hypothetical protein [Pseudomonas sp. C11]|uniref:hypothetical protein n=1 Tax=Pseudomonas sp. C11 TaxID=3075550 RepID=UPI002AFEF4C6|nr:hypothetical protein [Pseudomonas sp. C11]
MKPDEFIQQHAPNGEMTAEQAAQLLELVDMGDTGEPTPDTGSAAPAAATAEAAQAADGAQATDNVSNTDNAAAGVETEDPAKSVIMAKDNVHTIPYQRLQEAREGRQAAEAREQELLQKLQGAQQELEALRNQAQQRADAGIAPTDADKNLATAEAAMDAGIDPDIFGDFSPEALAKGVQALIAKSAPTLLADLVKQQVAPLQQKQHMTEQEAHAQAIYAKHPDLDSIIESAELDAWIESQPSFARNAYREVIGKGTAQEVIEFIDTYKEATGKTQAAAAAPASASVQAAAKQAVEAAKPAVPVSLSDIPGGRPGPATGHEALANLGAVDMAEALMDKSPEQIEAYLNRSV